LRNLFAVRQSVCDVQLNGVLDVLYRFLVRIALAVAALERGAGSEKAIGIRFDDDGKSNVLHDLKHYRPASNDAIAHYLPKNAKETTGRQACSRIA